MSMLEADGKVVEEGIQFSFRVNERLLRGSLKSFMLAHGITSEKDLEIKYSFAPSLPQIEQSNEEDDWISAIIVDEDFENAKDGYYYICTFGGAISVYNKEHNRRLMKKVSESPILSAEVTEVDS